MDLHAWGRQRAQYSRARHGRDERGASVGECALIQAVSEAMAMRMTPRLPVFGTPVAAIPAEAARTVGLDTASPAAA